MKLNGALFLAGYTARSQAYAQVMKKNGLFPEQTLFFGTKKSALPGQLKEFSKYRKITGIFTPRFSESLHETSLGCGWDTVSVPVDNVNDPAIYRKIIKLNPSLVIYSGYGGQIVGKDLIRTGIPFLHMHSGWLPDYRGSTTLYYSWLERDFCGVSAIILNENIDEGPVVARKKYPAPPERIDPDYVYDNAIRADLLVSVLKKYLRSGGTLKSVTQKGMGRTYFVIHPVLKHLARLRAEKGR